MQKQEKVSKVLMVSTCGTSLLTNVLKTLPDKQLGRQITQQANQKKLDDIPEELRSGLVELIGQCREKLFGCDSLDQVKLLSADALEPDVGLPCLDHLLELQKLLGGEGMARGPTRHVLGLIGQDLGQAKQRYKRWREVMSQKMPKELGQFDQLVTSLLKGEDKVWKELPYGEIDLETQTRHSPLGDVMALLAAERE